MDAAIVRYLLLLDVKREVGAMLSIALCTSLFTSAIIAQGMLCRTELWDMLSMGYRYLKRAVIYRWYILIVQNYHGCYILWLKVAHENNEIWNPTKIGYNIIVLLMVNTMLVQPWPLQKSHWAHLQLDVLQTALHEKPWSPHFPHPTAWQCHTRLHTWWLVEISCGAPFVPKCQ